jgi:branched-chain amino acid transport system permease protein
MAKGKTSVMVNQMDDWRTRFEFGSMLALFAASLFLPLVVSKPLATEIVIYALFALGFNLLLGHTGIISFGHAAYLGAGAYAAGMTIVYAHCGVWLALLSATLAGTVVAVVIGLLAIRRKGAYFAMISLAFAQMLYFIALSPMKHWTGGGDALKLPPLSIDFPLHLDLSDQLQLYFFVLVIGVIAVLVQWRVLNSPFGHVLKGTRENEDLIRACGYNIDRIKFVSLLFSGLFSGLAGGLLVVYMGAASVDILFWMTSGVVVMETVLGGIHTFLGPVIGSAIFLFLRDSLSKYTDRWEMWIGALFMVLILLCREGVWGTIVETAQRRFDKP